MSVPCRRVVTPLGTQTAEVTDPSSGIVVASFGFTQQASHWEGDLECFFQHEYDRQNWVTATITNRTDSTISFDYTVGVDTSFALYSGTVTQLAVGGSMEIRVCSLWCGSFSLGSLVVTAGPITYEP